MSTGTGAFSYKSTSSSSTRRPVARRACLLCREKKIKCDGEPINTVKTFHDDDKITTDKPRICSNCKFLGVECVFVASMRGGRRRKRTNEDGFNSGDHHYKQMRTKLPDSDHSNENSLDHSTRSVDHSVDQSVRSSDRNNSVNGSGSIAGRLNNFMLDQSQTNSIPKPVSPTLSYSSVSYKNDDDSAEMYPYDYRVRAYDLPGPPGPYGPSYYPHPPPPPPHHRHRYHRHKHHWPPPHKWGMMGYPPPPPPGPHGHPPPPFGFPPGPPPGIHGPPPGIHGPPPGSHGPPPPLEMLPIMGPPGLVALDLGRGSVSSQLLYWDHQPFYSHQQAKPVLPPLKPAHTTQQKSPRSTTLSAASASALLSSSAANHDIGSERSYPPTFNEAASIDGREAGLDEIPKVAFFSDAELAQFDLPKAQVLNQIIDYYYQYLHANHQILTKKDIFLLKISLNIDSSVLHALIATTMSLKSKLIKIPGDEDYWIANVFRFWDNLNDFGMLLSYALLSNTASIFYNHSQLAELNNKIYELFICNRYLEVFQQKLKMNNRQTYEREVAIRIIWDYWINHVVVFRFRKGFPYQNSNVDANDHNEKIDAYFRSFMLPLSGEEHLFFFNTEPRGNWDQFWSSNYKVNDSMAVLYSIKVLETTLNKIQNNDVSEVNVGNALEKVEQQIGDNLMIYKTETSFNYSTLSPILVLNSGYFWASAVLKMSHILHKAFMLKEVLVLRLFEPSAAGDNLQLLPEVNEGSAEQIADQAAKLTEDQWRLVFELFYLVNEMCNLLRLGEGRLPGDPKSYSIVLGASIGANSFYHKKDLWWKDKSLSVKGEDSWMKFHSLMLDFSCFLLQIVVSLGFLKKTIKFVANASGIEVHAGTPKQVNGPPTMFESLEGLGASEDVLVRFIRFKLNTVVKGELATQTITRLKQLLPQP